MDATPAGCRTPPGPGRGKPGPGMTKRVSDLVHVLRYVADGAGFEILGRVVLLDKRTGRVFK